MKDLAFQIKIEVEKNTGRVLAAYLGIRKGKPAKTREFADGAAFADYNARGHLLGIELLGPCDIRVFDRIAPRDPQVRKFAKGAVPRELVLA
jgi:uncharacterized protein YuzE